MASRALLLLLSTATLALEIVQVRVFSYSINPVFVYMVISLALLGIGASGTVLALAPRLRRIPTSSALAGCLVLFAVSSTVANFVFSRVSHLVTAQSGLTLLSPVVPVFLLFTVPYFFSGLGIALALLSDSRSLARNYFLNLVGSGAGCFLIYPFLESLGAERIVVAIAVVCALGGTLALVRSASRWAPACVLASLALILGLVFAERLLPFRPDASDFLAMAVERLEQAAGSVVEPRRVFSRWDPVGKIEIYEFPGESGLYAGLAPSLFFTQDAGAPSMMLGLGGRPELATSFAQSSVYGLATALRPEGEVLVVGLGGGPDLVATLAGGARRVTGVEINRAAIDAIGIEFRDFLGLPSADSGRLELHHADGRAFIRRTETRFDVIQMTGADTYAAAAVSGSILSENYLYTVEAFLDFLGALESDGILAITRFGIEPIKVITTGVAALAELGIEEPANHVAVVKQGRLWVLALIKKTPFTAAEIERIRHYCTAASSADLSMPVYDAVGFELNGGLRPLYYPGIDELDVEGAAPVLNLMRMVRERSLESWLESLPGFDFSPSTDDRPFFLQIERLHWPSVGELLARNPLDNPLMWSVSRYLGIVVQIAVLSLALILGPLVVFRRRRLRLAGSLSVAGYFFSIGAGFMLVEIGLVQRFTLFLGHPNFSISTILFTLLVASGVGSYVSGRWRLASRDTIRVAIVAIVVGVMSMAMFSGSLFEPWLGYGVDTRIVVSIAVLSPLAFFMGMPLPTMLTTTEQRIPHVSPWALSINGFASVLGSLATIPLTLAIGFTSTLSLGAVAYVLALFCSEVFRHTRRGDGGAD